MAFDYEIHLFGETRFGILEMKEIDGKDFYLRLGTLQCYEPRFPGIINVISERIRSYDEFCALVAKVQNDLELVKAKAKEMFDKRQI